jgi:hypothetical protein
VSATRESGVNQNTREKSLVHQLRFMFKTYYEIINHAARSQEFKSCFLYYISWAIIYCVVDLLLVYCVVGYFYVTTT